MKRAVWDSIVRAALLCLAAALLLGSFSLLGFSEPPLFAPAGFFLLVALALGGVAIAPAVVARRAPLIAYRALYRAPATLESTEATRLLRALARHGGRVSVIWRYHPSSKGSKSGDLSLYIVAPADWGGALEGILPRLLPGLWAERVPPPPSLTPSMMGRGVRCWRWDVVGTGACSGTIQDPLASGMYMGEFAARAGAWDVEAQIHLWRGGVAGLLLAECDLDEKHRDEWHTEPVRIKGSDGLQAAAESTLVHLPALHVSAQAGGSTRTQRENKRKRQQGSGTRRQAPQGAQGDPLLGPGLRPLLGGWLARRNIASREIGADQADQADRGADMGADISDKAGDDMRSSSPPTIQIEKTQVPANSLSRSFLALLRASLASLMCEHYPLWENWPPATEGNRKWLADSRTPVATALSAFSLDAPLVPVGGSQESEGRGERGERDRVPGNEARAVLFPATDGANVALDSHLAGVVAPPASYRLPHMPGRVLVLGRITAEDRPAGERVVGVPLLRRAARDAEVGGARARDAADNTGVIQAVADTHSPGKGRDLNPHSTGNPLSPASPASPASSGRPLRSPGSSVSSVSSATTMRLHDFAGNGLLVAGGTDAWRLDVAGSLARQGVEMGMPLIVIEGGSPPDEPPPIARRGARIEVADAQAQSSGTSQRQDFGVAGLADPFAPGVLGLGVGPRDPWGRGSIPNRGTRVAHIDPGNPNGSLHVNMLFVPPVRYAATPAIGEAAALILALRVALPAQMRFLDAVGVTGAGTGIGVGSETGATVLEAWLWVLLVRHHYSRLRYALNGGALTPEELCGQTRSRREDASDRHPETSSLPAIGTRHVLPCPDLSSILLLMEQSDALIEALQRERTLWEDPEWVRSLRSLGSLGEAALRAVYTVYERVRDLTSKDAGDLFRLCAGLRDRLKGAIGEPAMIRMLSGPPASLHDLLDSGTNASDETYETYETYGTNVPLRLLRVHLEGAYRTVQLPFTGEEGMLKRYGLYLLWAIWAFAKGRKAAARMDVTRTRPPAPACSATPSTPSAPTLLSQEKPENGQPAARAAARPVMLLVHGAGAWFGPGSPISSVAGIRAIGAPESGVLLGVTAAGLRHIRSHGADAYTNFGTLVVGPLPVGYEDAPDVALRQLEREDELHRTALDALARRVVSAWSFPCIEGSVADPARLMRVLRRLRDGEALIVAAIPDRKLTLCTASTGSVVVEAIRTEWAQEAQEIPEAELAISRQLPRYECLRP